MKAMRQAADKDLAVESGGGQQDGTGDGRHACRGAVHVVEEVERVDNQDDPEGRQDRRNDPALNEELDPDIGERCGQDRHEELKNQFDERPQRVLVIPETDEKENRGAQQDSQQLADMVPEVRPD